jgi:hypothetical protein
MERRRPSSPTGRVATVRLAAAHRYLRDVMKAMTAAHVRANIKTTTTCSHIRAACVRWFGTLQKKKALAGLASAEGLSAAVRGKGAGEVPAH